jgi:BNR/Asp-box repeat
MFGHLDDPTGVSPGEREMAKVLGRARVIRNRRRLGAVAASLIIIAGAAGFLASRPTSVHLSTSETAYQFNNIKGPLAVGTPVPTTALVNVVFASAQDGFALAAHRGRAVLATTTDGGSTWQVQNDTLPPGYGEGDGYAGEFEFEGDTGYLWGGEPGTSGADPLWITHDGGVTWSAASIGPVVYDVSAIGPDVWALSASCTVPSSGGSAATPCALTTEESLDAGASWSAAGDAGLPGALGALPLAQRVELARITLSRAYVLTVSDTPGQSGSAIALVYTDDSGQTWTPRPVPCSGAFDQGAEVAASSTDDLWLLCGSQASAGSQSKELYRSGDGGLTWSLAASATGLGTQAPPASQPNTLSLGGYVAPYSIGHKNLAVASATTAWLYPFRSVMYKTVDGGLSWSAVPGLDTAGFGSGGTGNVTFISATQGWICEYGVGLWHTSDGVHWSPLGE